MNARPTPGPYVIESLDILSHGKLALIASVHPWGLSDLGEPAPEDEANASLIFDAFNVHHETGLTPRQLADQRAELLAELKDACYALEQGCVDACLSRTCQEARKLPYIAKLWATIARAKGGAS